MRRTMCLVVAAAMAGLLIGGQVLAQRGGRGFGGPGGGGMLGVLQQRQVQREIELSDDQQQALRQLGQDIRNEIRDQMPDFRGMRDLSPDQRRARFEEFRTQMQQFSQDAESRVQQLLLPHQFERVEQIELQARIQRNGAAALTEGELAETLGLSQSQRDQLRQRSEQVEKEMQEKIKQLRAEARNQLLEVLTAQQRAQLESMMGPQFDLPEQRPGRRGGRGRGTGRGS